MFSNLVCPRDFLGTNVNDVIEFSLEFIILKTFLNLKLKSIKMNYKSILTIILFLISNLFVVNPIKINLRKFNLHLNLYTVPITCIIILLASKCIGGDEIKYGFVGDGTHLKPYDILLLFVSLALVVSSIEVTGFLQSLAFWVSNKGKSSGYALYFYFYSLFIILATFVGNVSILWNNEKWNV